MISLKDIRKTHHLGDTVVNALAGVDLEIENGDFVAIVGASGSGKSTLLHLLGLLDRPDCGSYTLAGTETVSRTDEERAAIRNGSIGFVFQQFHLLPRMSALRNAALPGIYAGKGSLENNVWRQFERLGLKARAHHVPNQLSGGEQQRVAIARALVNDPWLILADEPTGNLDSANAAEIMGILEALNREGRTVVMVTHERSLAARAARIIEVWDGRIVSDQRNREAVKGGIAQEEQLQALSHRTNGARTKDHVYQAWTAILAHKMRSFLSMLGILIGVAAVISMMAITNGAKESVEKSLSSLGSNTLVVRPGGRRWFGGGTEEGAATRLTIDDAERISRLSSVKHVSPTVFGGGRVVYGNKNWSPSIIGVGVDYPIIKTASPVLGRFFNSDEIESRDKVAVIGATVARELFGDENPVGRMITIDRSHFRVIGLFPAKGSSGFRDNDDIIAIPVSTAQFRIFGNRYLHSIDVEVEEAMLIEKAIDDIENLLRTTHRIPASNTSALEIRNLTEIREMLSATTKIMGWLLASIAMISLIVGGIGIMNIMLVSVTERTREIGLRKALGAANRDILWQFLVEAVVMSVGGGIIGVLAGMGGALALFAVKELPFKISIMSVCSTLLLSIFAGLIFGLWPARKASKLDPIEALRYE